MAIPFEMLDRPIRILQGDYIKTDISMDKNIENFIDLIVKDENVIEFMEKYKFDPNFAMTINIKFHTNSDDFKINPFKGNKSKTMDSYMNICPLAYFVARNNIIIVKKLLELNADVNYNLNCDNDHNSIMTACTQNNLAMFKLLLENNAEFDSARQSVYYKLCRNDYNFVKLLFDHYTDKLTDKYLFDFLIEGCETEQNDIVKLCIDYKADLSMVLKTNQYHDDNGNTCLFYAKSEQTAELLIKNKADPLIFNGYNKSCLYIACKNGYHDLAVYLSQFVSAFVTNNDDDRSPLDICSNLETVKYLINKNDKNFKYPELSKIKNPDIFEYYINIGVKIDINQSNINNINEDCLKKLFEYNIYYAILLDQRFTDGIPIRYQKEPFLRTRPPNTEGLLDNRFDENGSRYTKKRPSSRWSLTTYIFIRGHKCLEKYADTILAAGNYKRKWLQLPEHPWNLQDKKLIASIICSYFNY